MFDKLKDLNRLRKIQSDLKRQLENIFVTTDKSGISLVIRGDKKIEKIIIDGEENKVLKDVINDAMKDVDKKVEKQMRGQLGDLGLPGLS
jgi:DNA-binding protein YbaB